MVLSKKETIKQRMLELLPAATLAFVTCFMLVIYEPLFAYFTNQEDFWFDFGTIVKPLVKAFGVAFLASFAVFAVLYFVEDKFGKGHKWYEYVLLVLFGVFFATYIQGNFLVNNLPHLDGTEINWGDYVWDGIWSAVVLVSSLALILIFAKKYGREKLLKGVTYVALGVFALLGVSLLTSALADDGFRSKGDYYVTNKNINNVSTDENLLVFLLDSIDAETFAEAMKEHSQYKEIFEDFTFFPDTVSAYGFTRDTMPFIMSGVWNENEMKFRDYYSYAMDNSAMIATLQENDYDINIFDDELLWQNYEVVQNLEEGEPLLVESCFLKNEAKYVLFKYLPFYAKQLSKIETMGFGTCRGVPTGLEDGLYRWDDVEYYQRITTNELVKQDKKYFSMVHLEGTHGPFFVTENLEKSTTETSYDQMLQASVKLADTYLKRLKDGGVYDNSAIIIMADHGLYGSGRQNPMFMIKGRNEKHEYTVSETPVSYEDIVKIYDELIQGKKAEQAVAPYKRETRRFIYNGYNDEDHMVEYEQTGKAWDKSTLVPTGREFNR